MNFGILQANKRKSVAASLFSSLWSSSPCSSSYSPSLCLSVFLFFLLSSSLLPVPSSPVPSALPLLPLDIVLLPPSFKEQSENVLMDGPKRNQEQGGSNLLLFFFFFFFLACLIFAVFFFSCELYFTISRLCFSDRKLTFDRALLSVLLCLFLGVISCCSCFAQLSLCHSLIPVHRVESLQTKMMNKQKNEFLMNRRVSRPNKKERPAQTVRQSQETESAAESSSNNWLEKTSRGDLMWSKSVGSFGRALTSTQTGWSWVTGAFAGVNDLPK